jgi:hypothetical protein
MTIEIDFVSRVDSNLKLKFISLDTKHILTLKFIVEPTFKWMYTKP